MKITSNDIVLRPRFQLEITEVKEKVLAALEKSEKAPFLVKRIDEHIFIKFDQKENHFWSPQLHIEVEELDKKNSKIFGVFGPNPTLWTFFMFLHFGVATIFIILGIWAYSIASLGKPYVIQIGLMIIMLILWASFYIFGRIGRQKGKPQMKLLHQFLIDTLVELQH
ncbi:GTP-binding protein [uncultured Croceitalea sp.]|uniref:GTP-binding protein n=1 Tax=uncultured Croceitalea sp. TaxID=1798908 RepID=UPI003305D52C